MVETCDFTWLHMYLLWVELSRLQYKYTYRCKYTQTNKYFGAAHISLLKVAAFNWTPSCLSNLVFGISMRKMFACTHNSYEWHIAAVPRLTRTRNVFPQTSGKNPGAVQKCMHWAIFFLALISCFKEILLILHQIPGAFTLFDFPNSWPQQVPNLFSHTFPKSLSAQQQWRSRSKRKKRQIVDSPFPWPRFALIRGLNCLNSTTCNHEMLRLTWQF